MTEPKPKTLVCPQCGNTNPYSADECLKCGLSLGSIRDAMAQADKPAAKKATAAPTQTKEPAPPESKKPPPPMPELPARGSTQDIGGFVDSARVLLRGVATQAEEVAAHFFSRLEGRGIPELSLSAGKLIVENQSHDYYFAAQGLGEGAEATMAVRIDPVGTDLIVQWRHYELPSIISFNWGVFLTIGLVAVGLGICAGIVTVASLSANYGNDVFNGPCLAVTILGIIVASVLARDRGRVSSLKGFQSQASIDFQMAVRAALEEAIDLVGISKELIQEVPKEQRRVI